MSSTGIPTTRRPEVLADDPDADAARRWMRVLRRVHRVEIVATGDGAYGVVHGIGHRLPVARTVPLGVALGFRELGVPVVARREA